jgi:hypothetical protein
LYESGEGERRGIVEEEVADVTEEERAPQTECRAIFVSLSYQYCLAGAVVLPQS